MWYMICKYFLSFCRFPFHFFTFIISYKTDLVATHSLSFCLSRDLFMKNGFTGYRILDWFFFFSFKTFNMAFHCFLASFFFCLFLLFLMRNQLLISYGTSHVSFGILRFSLSLTYKMYSYESLGLSCVEFVEIGCIA